MEKNFSLPGADIRLEVILAELGALGIPADDIVILRQSLFRRNYSNEIDKVAEVAYHGRRKRIAFHINREGIYDRLPQNLIHQPDLTEAGEKFSAKGAIDDIEKHEEREKGARLFCLPFEQEVNRLLLRLEWEERQFIFETNSDVSGELMGLFWDMPEALDSLQRSKLGVLIPLLHRFGGNLDRLAFILENITGYAVVAERRPPLSYTMPETLVLGDAFLGVDSLLGGVVRETQDSLYLEVRANRLEDLDDLVPGGRTLGILEYLTDALVPLEQDLVVHPDLGGCAPSWVLEEGNPNQSRLQYTTVL